MKQKAETAWWHECLFPEYSRRRDVEFEQTKNRIVEFLLLAALFSGMVVASPFTIYFRAWFVMGVAAVCYRVRGNMAFDEETTLSRELYFGIIDNSLFAVLFIPPLGLLGGRSWRMDYADSVSYTERWVSSTIHAKTAWEIAQLSTDHASKRADDISKRAHEVALESPKSAGRIALLLAALTGSARSSEAEDDIKVTTTYSYVTPYVVKNGIRVHNKPVVQIDSFVTLPAGYFADFWISSDLERQRTFGDEIDWTFGWSNTKFTISVRYFDLSPVWSNKESDLVCPNIEYRHQLPRRLQAFAGIDVNVATLRTSTLSGAFIDAGLRHSKEVNPLISLSQEMMILRDTGVFGVDPFGIMRYQARVSGKLNDRLSANVFLKYHLKPGSPRNELAAGAGMTLRVY